MDNETWAKVMALKAKETRTKGIANTLTDDEIETILATMYFFDADGNALAQTKWDLTKARYRLFDFLGMAIGGRLGKKDMSCVKVLVYSYLKSDGDVDKFIQDLRESDYQIDESWTSV